MYWAMYWADNDVLKNILSFCISKWDIIRVYNIKYSKCLTKALKIKFIRFQESSYPKSYLENHKFDYLTMMFRIECRSGNSTQWLYPTRYRSGRRLIPYVNRNNKVIKCIFTDENNKYSIPINFLKQFPAFWELPGLHHD